MYRLVRYNLIWAMVTVCHLFIYFLNSQTKSEIYPIKKCICPSQIIERVFGIQMITHNDRDV